MEYKKTDECWVIVLRKGERIIEKLTDFIETEGIRSGHLNAIGAVSEVELAHYNLEKKRYNTKQFSQALEIVSLMGNVTMKGNESIIHCHIVVGTNEMNLYGGHLKEATVAATCEIIFNELEEVVYKEQDEDTGLNLINMK